MWLEALLGGAGAAPLVAGPVVLTTRTPASAVERFQRGWRFAQSAWVAQGWAATANLLVDRTAFDAVGGFDEAYRHIAEDADLCIRAGRAGFRLGYCAAAEVHHAADARAWPMLKRLFWHGYSSAQALRRVGYGHCAWRHPRPLVDGAAARAAFAADDAQSMTTALARAGYAMRVAGSVWSEVLRAS
jgi:hypothetical protein